MADLDNSSMDTKRLSSEVITRMKAVVDAESDIELSTYFGGSKMLMSNRKMRGSVPYDEAVQLAIEREVSLDQLILGKGEGPNGTVAPVAGVSEPGGATHSDEFIDVQLYDLGAVAGTGRLFSEERVRYVLHFRCDWIASEGLYQKDLVALEVAGDSIIPTLQDSDTVLVNRALKQPDGVFLLRMGESLRIKRVQQLADNSLRLSSDNEFYTPEVVPPEALTSYSDLEIIGHCHWRAGRVY